LQPYSYILIKPDYYAFTTNGGTEYHCYFYTAEEIFSDFPELASKAFGFNLAIKNSESTPKGLDKRIAVTIATILIAFLSDKKNAVIYICDNSDGHEKARFHKFTNWFRTYNDGSFIQLKGVIHAGGIDILNALLIHKENSLLNDFIEAYQILVGSYTKPDDDELQNILNDPEW
jgi:Family of unknown function (DUF6169)